MSTLQPLVIAALLEVLLLTSSVSQVYVLHSTGLRQGFSPVHPERHPRAGLPIPDAVHDHQASVESSATLVSV
ncbi:hypothetical protein DER44DRAFT_759780 [Fusarium oxysporum]|nr:hypothetical protein DER44DRAFT_759780 [Fusarium oxysporum]